ncbi:hypothetical protein EMPS_02420 [Entomortierella parvispora]|uniref:Rubisco LSMT substrate-binding domain-containing protein n=1 Tax=Entomortierella parvispora TaxID=205924 RepID=A0A9P3H4N9_9FUNG|nr:hypothetical protein EMPS_02420 [Entomortierella parvispora]
MDSAHDQAHNPSKQKRFVQWLVDNNAHFPKLEFRDDDEGCGSVYASADIVEDEVFLIIPFHPLVITDTLARKNLEPLLVNLPSNTALDNRTALTLFLIQQVELGSASFFHPYLDMIPSRIHTALEFDNQDMEFLHGTNAFLTVQELKETLKARYSATMALVSQQMDPAIYTWERFLWAETVISSRTFPAHLFGDDVEGELVLIPLGDTLNHKSRHKVTWIKTPQGLEMSSAAVGKGEQMYNNYGPKSNEELLVGYGFCTVDNEDDTVTLKTNFSRDPDQERKAMILKHMGITQQTIHYLRHGYIPDQLLVTMRVMAMNPAEVDICYELADQEDLSFKKSLSEPDPTGDNNSADGGNGCSKFNGETVAELLTFLNVRNEFAMLDLLDMLMGAKLQGILEWDTRLTSPQNQAQEFAHIYREEQKQILRSCSSIARGMMSKLLQELSSGQLDMGRAIFMRGQDSSSRRPLSVESYTSEMFQECATKETRTMTGLKQDVVSQVLLTAKGVMIENKGQVFGEAFVSAFPNHGWGDEKDDGNENLLDLDEEGEMAMQMEQDAILTCFLVLESHQPRQRTQFISAAKTANYSSQLDEDMKEDVEDLRQSLQETLESVDAKTFDFDERFTSEAFIWATGLLEALSVSLHIEGERITGLVAPKDCKGTDDTNRRGKRKLEVEEGDTQ